MSESGRLCHGNGSHEGGNRHRRPLMLTILPMSENVGNSIPINATSSHHGELGRAEVAHGEAGSAQRQPNHGDDESTGTVQNEGGTSRRPVSSMVLQVSTSSGVSNSLDRSADVQSFSGRPALEDLELLLVGIAVILPRLSTMIFWRLTAIVCRFSPAVLC